MAKTTAGIDPHQDTFTVGIVDEHGVEIVVRSFANTSAGYVEVVDLLGDHVSSRSASRARAYGGATSRWRWWLPG